MRARSLSVRVCASVHVRVRACAHACACVCVCLCIRGMCPCACHCLCTTEHVLNLHKETGLADVRVILFCGDPSFFFDVLSRFVKPPPFAPKVCTAVYNFLFTQIHLLIASLHAIVVLKNSDLRYINISHNNISDNCSFTSQVHWYLVALVIIAAMIELFNCRLPSGFP